MGEAYRSMGQHTANRILQLMYFARADTSFEAGLKVFPQDETILIRYAQTLDALQHFAEAEVIYQKLFSLDPNLDIIHDYYGTHLRAEGYKAKADALERELERSRTAPVDADQMGNSPAQ
jgi:tetratricopeptide (TPR) repeat protein